MSQPEKGPELCWTTILEASQHGDRHRAGLGRHRPHQRDCSRAGAGAAQPLLGYGLAVADPLGAGGRSADLSTDRQPLRSTEAPRGTAGRWGGDSEQPEADARASGLSTAARVARLGYGPQPAPGLATQRAEQLGRTVPRLRG